MYVHRQYIYIYRYCIYNPFELTFQVCILYISKICMCIRLYQPLKWHCCVWVYMNNYWFTRIFISPHNYTLYSRLMGNTFFISFKGTPLRFGRVTHYKRFFQKPVCSFYQRIYGIKTYLVVHFEVCYRTRPQWSPFKIIIQICSRTIRPTAVFRDVLPFS